MWRFVVIFHGSGGTVLAKMSLKWLALLLYCSGMTHLCLLNRRRVFRRHGVYVLSYHHVVNNGASDSLGHDVSAKRSEEQLRFLKKWFEIVSLGEALKLLANGPLPRLRGNNI